MNPTTINWSDIEAVQPMTSAVSNQREQAMSQFFATVARKRQAVRRTLRNLSVSGIYRQELKAARRMAKAIDSHPTLSNVCLWAMGIAFTVEIFMKG